MKLDSKIFDGMEPAEIAGNFILSDHLSAEQKKLASIQLMEARKLIQSKATGKELLTANLLKLKFQLEDYLDNQEFNEAGRFGNFLKKYLQVLNKKRNEFSKEISVHETLISQLINNNRTPSENIIIRLELHSNNNIPAEYWFRLIEKEKIHGIKTNRKLRTLERNKVSNKVSVKI